MKAPCIGAAQMNSPSWSVWRSQGGSCCHGAWGCCCPRKQEGGAAADASPPGGKEDKEGLSVASFTVSEAAYERCLEADATTINTDGKNSTVSKDVCGCLVLNKTKWYQPELRQQQRGKSHQSHVSESKKNELGEGYFSCRTFSL